MDPLLLAANFAAPPAIIIAIVVIVIGLLILRFIFKTVLTILKISFLVAVGVATYVGLSFLFGS